MLMELTAEFVKTLNKTIPSIKPNDKSKIQDLELIKERIETQIISLESAEKNIVDNIKKIENYDKNRSDEPIYIRANGEINAIITFNETKPIITAVEKIEEAESSLFSLQCTFQKFENYFLIENELQLRDLDKTLLDACVAVFDHDYRSYEGFTCFIAVYIPDGNIYIIDCIKFREIIPKLKLLRKNVNKIIHCQKCVERLIKDFGCIQSYQNFNLPETDLYVDWRIRPLNNDLISIICNMARSTVENLNNNIPLEHHEPIHYNELETFSLKFNLPSDLDILNDLLKLRQYLARINDESLEHIMTDNQLYMMIINNPVNVEEFECLFSRMSSTLRLHATDFILILRRRNKFSIDDLKSDSFKGSATFQNVPSFITGRFKNFEAKEECSNLDRQDPDSESTLVISE